MINYFKIIHLELKFVEFNLINQIWYVFNHKYNFVNQTTPLRSRIHFLLTIFRDNLKEETKAEAQVVVVARGTWNSVWTYWIMWTLLVSALHNLTYQLISLTYTHTPHLDQNCVTFFITNSHLTFYLTLFNLHVSM